jgi:hypothetical protein
VANSKWAEDDKRYCLRKLDDNEGNIYRTWKALNIPETSLRFWMRLRDEGRLEAMSPEQAEVYPWPPNWVERKDAEGREATKAQFAEILAAEGLIEALIAQYLPKTDAQREKQKGHILDLMQAFQQIAIERAMLLAGSAYSLKEITDAVKALTASMLDIRDGRQKKESGGTVNLFAVPPEVFDRAIGQRPVNTYRMLPPPMMGDDGS